MRDMSFYIHHLKTELRQVSTLEKAESSRRYFPEGFECLGVNAADIKQILKRFQTEYADLNAEQTLELTEAFLKEAKYNEEFLLAFALINKFVKRHYEDTLLARFEYWLEHYADNWSLVDDLCLKSIFNFLMARPHLIESMQHWALSKNPWCRRASCVVWVKFIKRKMGKQTYFLNTALVFKQCNLLLEDKNEFVQKGVGWLLKVTAIEHQAEVIRFIKENINRFTRPTLRYAIEKMDGETRKVMLQLS
ncbi:DNA alkylation repair protein [Marinomonas sp. S3726]|nr:DNA alkylation repair protein [Marinomonas sp. S3726]